MRPGIALLAGLLASITNVFADDGSGLNGFPSNPYDPFCAMACVRSVSTLILDCSDVDHMSGMMATVVTPSSCWASNTPYLTSLAWCMHEKCYSEDGWQQVPIWKLEWYVCHHRREELADSGMAT